MGGWSNAWAKWSTGNIRNTASNRRVHSGAFFRRLARVVDDGRTSFRRATPEDAPRRARPPQGLRGLRCGRQARRFADRNSRQDDQGLWPWRSGGGRNTTHQEKKLDADEMRAFRSRFAIPIGDDSIKDAPFYRFPEESEEFQYLKEHREALGGPLPARRPTDERLEVPPLSAFEKTLKGSGGREASTTMAFGALLSSLLKDKHIGKRVVPIIPDKARTFGIEGLFAQCGILLEQGSGLRPGRFRHDHVLQGSQERPDPRRGDQ